MRRAAAASFLVLAVAGLLAVAVSNGAGGPTSPRAYASARYGYSVPVPSGWHRARARLVPKLLSPREILSLGTSPMKVGGGGNCGREPVATISRMRGGDALVSIQEYAADPAMRKTIAASSAPPPLRAALAGLRLRPEQAPAGRPVPAGARLWTATLPFSGRDRWFDALVYVRGTPARGRLRQVRAVLAGLRLRPGSFVDAPG